MESESVNLSTTDSVPIFALNVKTLSQKLGEAGFTVKLEGSDNDSKELLRFFEFVRSNKPEKLDDLATVLRQTGHSDLIPYVHYKEVLSSNKIESLCKYFPEIDVKVKQAINIIPPSDTVYKMTALPKGLALVINNKTFDLENERFGSERDYKYLVDLFSQLGYVVYQDQNLTAQKMKNVLQNFAQMKEHASADSCIIAISTHGKDRYQIKGTDDEYLDVDYNIAQLFNNENCPALIGKPKIFFIQACRGSKIDQGVDVVDSKVFSPAIVYRRSPTWTDMIFVQSTIPGYVSNRNICEGSWFIQSLVKVMMESACEEDLETMMKMVTNSVIKYQTNEAEMQAPEVILRGWRKRLFFNPMLIDSSTEEMEDSESIDSRCNSLE